MNFKNWLETLWDYDNDAFGRKWDKENREQNAIGQLKNQEFIDRQTFVAYHRTHSAEIANKIMRGGFDLTPVGERVYGNGIYFSLGLKDWRGPKAAAAYGNYLIAASIPGNRIVDGERMSWQKQVQELGVDPKSIGIEPGQYALGASNADVINALGKTGKIDGVSFSGKGGGTGWLVVFNPKTAKPVKVAYVPENQSNIQWMKQIGQTSQ
jgi:hypothetical protein